MTPRLMFLPFAALAAVLFLSADGPAPLFAQAKKSNSEENHLRQQVQKLQDQVQSRDLKIQQLQQQLNTKNSTNSQLQTTLTKENKELDKLRQTAKDLDTLRQTKYVHTLILRLKDNANQKEVKTLLDSAPKTLGKLPGVRGVWLGKPAGSASDGVQADYQVGVTILFDDVTAYRNFLKDAGQKKFSDGLKKAWDEPTVYDFQP